MKNKGLSLVETLVVVFIAVSFLAIIFGVFIAGRNSWAKSAAYIDLQEKSRYALDKIARELSQSRSTEVTIENCPHPTLGACYGQYIEFKIPVVTTGDVANTIYHDDGGIKFGVNGEEGWSIKYLVASTGANDHRLLRIIPEHSSTPPTGRCCVSTSCSIRTEADCLDMSGSYGGTGTTCDGAYPCGSDPEEECFLAKTPILMADGSTKPIENVKVGDLILAFDEETKTLKEDKVSKFFEHDADEYLVINENLKATANHPVYSEGKWTEIGKLKVGDKLLNAQGKPEEIKSIKLVKEPVKVYNLEVNPYNTYIASGIVVHNKDERIPCPPEGCPNFELNKLWRSFLFPLAYADETLILASDIKEMRITQPYPGTPRIIDISITAQKKTMLDEVVELTLNTRIFLRN